MQVDFYHCTRASPEAAVPLIAAKALASGERLVIVAADAAQRARIGEALWQRGGETFLANGEAGTPHAARQPVLLAADPVAANGARFAVLADGEWRDAPGMARVFLLFGEETREAARAVWRRLGERDGIERRYWTQTERGWQQQA